MPLTWRKILKKCYLDYRVACSLETIGGIESSNYEDTHCNKIVKTKLNHIVIVYLCGCLVLSFS
jgi:hypothetical protein